jgi:hypothetical protein
MKPTTELHSKDNGMSFDPQFSKKIFCDLQRLSNRQLATLLLPAKSALPQLAAKKRAVALF